MYKPLDLRPVHRLNYSMQCHSKRERPTKWIRYSTYLDLNQTGNKEDPTIASNSSPYSKSWVMALEVEMFGGCGLAEFGLRKVWRGSGWGRPGGRAGIQRSIIHKPCLAKAAVISSARVANCGESIMLRLPEDDRWLSRWRWGETKPDSSGDWTTISAPWSTRAFAWSRKVSLWLSI